MHNTMYRHVALACTALLILGGTSRVQATELYSDNVMTNGGTTMGETELFSFVWGCCPIFDTVEITVEDGVETNQMAGLVAVDGAQGGHGLALHVDYNPATGFPGHGLLQSGNVIRVSCWVALDPAAPMNHQDLSYAVIKIEFADTELYVGANPPPPEVLFDTDLNGGLNTLYLGVPTADDWTQVVFEYVYDSSVWSAATLEEMRPVIIQGYDADATRIDGNSLVDNLLVEVFTNAADAAASPVDMTNPGLLPGPFVYFDVEIVDVGRTNTTIVTFDSQPGVQYTLEYSESGAGGPWTAVGDPISGDGTPLRIQDPDGPSATRTYRIAVVDPQFVLPL